MAQHFFHGFDIQTLAGNFWSRFILRQDFRKASHFTLSFKNGLGLVCASFFQNTLRLTVSPRLNFVGVSFRFTNVLLFVFTCGNRIIKRGFYFFRRTSRLEVDVQQGNPHVVRTNGLFQLTLSIATNDGTSFSQDTVHGVFTDHAAQGAVGSLTQAIVRAGDAEQIAFRIGHAVLHVHLNAHDVFVRRQHDAGSRQFTDRLNVNRLNAINEGRFPVKARLNQMAKFTKASDDATFSFFNGIKTAGCPDNNRSGGNDADDTPAHWPTRSLRAATAAQSTFSATQAAKFFA